MIPPLTSHWKYSSAHRLGGGGYAQVYAARHATRAGEYAIKVLDNPFYANTFEQEVRMLQALQGCPRTPALVDAGRNAAGRLCIVTEQVPGVRLDRYVRHQGPLSLNLTMRLLEQVLDVLAFAHARNILHKDLKASNILMDGDHFTVLDWGVSQFRGTGRLEVIRAKQDFVAPECYHGQQDVATDVYALGWLVIYALSGTLPYHFADVPDAAYRGAAHCLERPQIPESIPSPLRHLVANWLQKQPHRRLIGYDVSTLLTLAQTSDVDAYFGMEFRQLRHECSFLHRAARHGVPYSQYELARGLMAAKRTREADFWLHAAACQGYARAMYPLSRRLSRENPVLSRHWLEKAAAAESANAQYRLGQILLAAEGEAAETSRGIVLLRRAAEAGHGAAQYVLFQYLSQTSPQTEEAQVWLYRAADRGEAPPYWQTETDANGGDSHQQPSALIQDSRFKVQNSMLLAPQPFTLESGLLSPGTLLTSPWHIVEATRVTDLDAHADAWDTLAQHCPAAYPSQSFGWLRAFYAHKLEPDERMVCLLGYQGKTLAGVLPLISGCRIFGLGWSPHHYRVPYYDYHTVRVDALTLPESETVLEAFVDYLEQTRGVPPVLRLRKLPETSPTRICCLRPDSRLSLLERRAGEEHRIHPAGDYATWFAGLNGKFRRELRRQARRLEERATVQYQLRNTSRSASGNLKRFMAVENSGWKGQKQTSIETLSGEPPLYRAAAEHFTARNWMEWNFLEADGQTIAGQYAVRLNRTLFLWKVGYREDYANCAPSHLLFDRVVENACHAGDVDTINFMARRTWLRVWNVTPYPLYNLLVYPREAPFETLIETAVKKGYGFRDYTSTT